MKTIQHLGILLTFAAVVSLIGCHKENTPTTEQPANDSTPTDTIVPEEPADDIYQFKVLDGNGDSVALSQYRGKVLLVVNTATQCGYTPQYTDLQRIYEAYKDSGFVILDFPCNQFGSQAPGSYDDIHDFCTGRYGITFPQFAKIDVNGANASPLYVWLKTKKPGDIKWNFTKFLLDRKGEVIRRFEPANSMSTVESAIVKAL
ncbi:MAG: glutathione peroxidase [Bacteroidales bacterium]|jgi:glutathione peroxidase|nr:glutathione peroxidase [Bacteroidales bacterium]